ncbi:MAG: hypothetical protein AAF720_13855 [Pseudomonadota bacterium]
MKYSRKISLRRKFILERGVASIAATLVLSMGGSAFADVMWRIETTGEDGDTSVKEVTEIVANQKNIRFSVPGEGDLIFLGKEEKIIMIDHGEKSYSFFEPNKIAALTSAMPDLSATMANVMEGMDADTRALVAGALGQGGGAAGQGIGGGIANALSMSSSFEVTKSSASYKVLGAKADAYAITENGVKTGEVWVARPEDIKGGTIVRDRMKDLAQVMSKAMGPFAKMMESPLQYVNAVDGGVPVGATEFGTSGKPTRSELVAATDKPTSASFWQAPSGYKEQSLQ